MTKRKSIIQTHHICYNPEVTVKIYKGEHWLLTQLQRRKKVSEGFVVSVEAWLALNRRNAVKLEGS